MSDGSDDDDGDDDDDDDDDDDENIQCSLTWHALKADMPANVPKAVHVGVVQNQGNVCKYGHM